MESAEKGGTAATRAMQRAFVAESEGKPVHYMGYGVDCEDALRAAYRDGLGLPPMALYWWGTAFKYIWRWPAKGQPMSDIDKCIDCLERLKGQVDSDVYRDAAEARGTGKEEAHVVDY